MAKNQVTLTFAGDSQSLEKSFDKVGAGARKLEADLGRAEGAAGRYGRGIEGVGNRADEMDTRMMGASDGITGLNDLMNNGELSAAGYAMAFADIGSAIYNTVAPSVADLRDKLRGVPDDTAGASRGLSAVGDAADGTGGRLGRLGNVAAIAGGAAGLGALAFGLYQAGEASKEFKVDVDELALSLSTASGADELARNLEYASRIGVDASEAFDKILEQSPELAGGFIEVAEAAGVESDEIAYMRSELRDAESATTAVEDAQARYNDELTNGAQSVRDYSDALTAAFDPVFGMYDALGQNREAQVAVTEAQHALNEAIRDHGAGSAEAAAAEQALTDAQMANAESALGVTAAQNELIASIRTGETSVSNLRAQMQTWDQQGLLSQGVLEAVAAQLGITTDEAIRLGGIDPNVDISAVDRASSPIQNIAANLGWLDGQQATVTVIERTVRETVSRMNPFSGWGAATGGIAPQYLASGGMSGPRGTDTVPAWLTPGEMVLNAGQQAELFAMANGRGGGGGGDVHFHIGGIITDRDITKVIRQVLSSGGFRGVR